MCVCENEIEIEINHLVQLDNLCYNDKLKASALLQSSRNRSQISLIT